MTDETKPCPTCGSSETFQDKFGHYIVHRFTCTQRGAVMFRYPKFTPEKLESPHWETTEDGGSHVFIDACRRIKTWHSVGYCPDGCPLISEVEEAVGEGTVKE